MARARTRGVTTAFAVRGFGYYEPRYFERRRSRLYVQPVPDRPLSREGRTDQHADRAADRLVHGRRAHRLARVRHLRPPGAHKGLLLFARLADMLGSRRPDIPILVVQSGQSGGALNGIPGIDFSKYPQIMAAPPVPTPADYFALTRILLVPSVWDEPFGRVAAEAMINGIPPIVGNRGSLPQVVGGDFADGGGGRVLPIPDWMTPETTRLPASTKSNRGTTRSVRCGTIRRSIDRSRRERAQIADERYSEDVSRKQHVDYFTSLKPGGRPISVFDPRPIRLEGMSRLQCGFDATANQRLLLQVFVWG